MDPIGKVKADPRRALPAVDRLARKLRARNPSLAGWARLEASRRVLAEAREELDAGGSEGNGAPSLEALTERAGAIGSALCASHPRRVINATGIPLHTNLGRAPLAPGAAAAAAAAASSYTDLELDLATGRRGNRLAAVSEKLRLLGQSEGALVVNNNAAAVLLALDTLARGREVIVSRGELVEIGGSFRVPDIMERAGVKLVEVGTTNRTHPQDYERAIGPNTALLLKIHRSNFEQRGFVAEVGLAQLAELGRARELLVVEDLGSGSFVDLSAKGFPEEVYAPARLKRGADLVCFSADKLLGGPQAGIVLGSATIVEAMRRNPMARPLRLDKLSLSALDWTLEAYLDGRAEREVPVLRQLLEPLEGLEPRARSLAERLEEIAGDTAHLVVERDRAFVGGGSLPGFELDTWVVTARAEFSVERLAKLLLAGPVPVIARLRDDHVVFDVRTLLAGDEDDLARAFGAALRRCMR